MMNLWTNSNYPR